MRRRVRATHDLFDALDRQLPADRDEQRPSRRDFETYDLLEIVERFATEWDSLPRMIRGREEYRTLITQGRVVAFASIVGQLASDGAIELVDIDIDLEGL